MTDAERIANLERQNAALREVLDLMIGYLGHQDQDADHAWMVKEMRAALSGTPTEEKP